MAPKPAPMTRRRELILGIQIAVGIGCAIAFVVQALAPVVAKLPGLILCGGGELELLMRRRTSYGVCTGGGVVSYPVILAVSSLVWSLLFLPVGLAIARWKASRRRSETPDG